MRVHLKTLQVKIMQTVINTLKELKNDVNLHFDKHGLHIYETDKPTDPKMVVQLDLTETAEYEYNAPNEFLKVGIHLTKMSQVMNSVGTYQILELDVDNETSVTITMTNKPNGIKTIYTIPTIDTSDTDIPKFNKKLKYDHVVDLPSKTLKDIINQIDKCAKCVQFMITNNSMIIESMEHKDQNIQIRTELFNNNSLENSKNTAKITSNRVKAIGQGRYDVHRVKEFMKCASINNNINFCIESQTSILLISCKVGDLGTLQYYLMPHM